MLKAAEDIAEVKYELKQLENQRNTHNTFQSIDYHYR